jgi:hypothetical protein
MKITKSTLKKIIKEELGKVLNEESGGYHVKMVRKEYGGQVPKFYDPEGNELEDEYGDSLASGDILEATEKLDGFFDIVNKETLEAHRAQSRFPYPDSEVMMDRGFMPGKGYEDLLQLYAAKVLRTSELNEIGYYGLGAEPFGAEKYRKKIQGFADMLDKAPYGDPIMKQLESAIKLSVSEILSNIEDEDVKQGVEQIVFKLLGGKYLR